MHRRLGLGAVASLISTHWVDHLLVGTTSVPICTDPFAVHAVSEETPAAPLCAALVRVAVDNDVCGRR